MNLSPSKLLSTGLICLAVLFSNSAYAGKEASAQLDSPEQANVGTPVTFSGMRSHGGNKTYSWTIDNAEVGTQATLVKTYDTVGEFKVTLTVTADPVVVNGVSETTASFTKFITIRAAGESVTPLTSFMMSAPADTVTNKYVVGEMIQFDSKSTSVGNSMINNHWDFGELGNTLAENNNRDILPVQNLTLSGNGTDTFYTTVTREFRAPGKYTITLFSQVGFPDPANLAALTGVYQKTVTVVDCPVGTTCLANPVIIPVAKLYNDNCGRCHGVVDTVKDPITKVITGYLPTIVKGEHSLLIDTGAVPKPAFPKILPVTDLSILAAYSIETENTLGEKEMLMAGVKVLTLEQAGQVAIFLKTLTLRENQTGAEVYRAQCSRCHGTGTGGYASNVLNKSVGAIKNGINIVPEMVSLPTSDAELALIVEFLNTTTPAVLPQTKAPLPKPLTGAGLNIMYCSYCHGNDGFGGPFVDETIAGVGVTASIIRHEIEKEDSSNKMSLFNILLLDNLLLESDLEKIAAKLADIAVISNSDDDDDDE